MQLCQKGYTVFLSLRYNLKSCGLFRISSIVVRIFFGGNINIHATGFDCDVMYSVVVLLRGVLLYILEREFIYIFLRFSE